MTTASNYRVRTLRLPNGLQLEFAEQGAPADTTVLLLHGSTDSWRSFEALLPLLPAHWHVIAPSQRGHGRSDKTASDYGTRAFAADAAALAYVFTGYRPVRPSRAGRQVNRWERVQPAARVAQAASTAGLSCR